MSILIKNSARGTCPVVQWLRLPSMQEVQIQFLVIFKCGCRGHSGILIEQGFNQHTVPWPFQGQCDSWHQAP